MSCACENRLLSLRLDRASASRNSEIERAFIHFLFTSLPFGKNISNERLLFPLLSLESFLKWDQSYDIADCNVLVSWKYTLKVSVGSRQAKRKEAESSMI